MANLDGLGSLLGFGYGMYQQDKRQRELNDVVSKAGATPLEKMEAMLRYNPSLAADSAFQGQMQKAYEFNKTQEAAATKAAAEAADTQHEQDVISGAQMYAPGMPGEDGQPITAEQSRDYTARIMLNAPRGSETRKLGGTLLGNVGQAQVAEQAAGVAADQEQARFERDDEAKRLAAATQFGRQEWAAKQAEARAAGKPPAGYDLVGGVLTPKAGTKDHTAIIDRVSKGNEAALAIDDYSRMLESGNVGAWTGAERAKAHALRSKLATGVMLAANGKSDADYKIALERVPDLTAIFETTASQRAALDVLKQELNGAAAENKKLFGHVPGFTEPIPAGFFARPKPKAATR